MPHQIRINTILSSLTGVPPQRLMRNGLRRWQRFHYREGCRRDARLVTELGRLNRNSRILDVGFGTGRLGQGILDTLGTVRCYTGIEVSRPHVDWCRLHFKRHSFMEFFEVEMRNDRYRPYGTSTLSPLPLPNTTFDIACFFSVFTHLLPDDLDFYLAELARVLKIEGRVIFTIYQDDANPAFSINPKNAYGPYEDSPLHRVRYNRHFLAAKLQRYGFSQLHTGQTWLQNQELMVLEKSGL